MQACNAASTGVSDLLTPTTQHQGLRWNHTPVTQDIENLDKPTGVELSSHFISWKVSSCSGFQHYFRSFNSFVKGRVTIAKPATNRRYQLASPMNKRILESPSHSPDVFLSLNSYTIYHQTIIVAHH
ncbi:hypothetical protein J6590_052520 [Homalodisca vitripennis]|nr:hypothetical protein J6590_052520 [Homalodisca vitripennis]